MARRGLAHLQFTLSLIYFHSGACWQSRPRGHGAFSMREPFARCLTLGALVRLAGAQTAASVHQQPLWLLAGKRKRLYLQRLEKLHFCMRNTSTAITELPL